MKFLLVATYSGADFAETSFHGITVRILGQFTNIQDAVNAAVADNNEVATEFFEAWDEPWLEDAVEKYTEDRNVNTNIAYMEDYFKEMVGMTMDIVTNEYEDNDGVNAETYTLTRIE